MARLLTPQEFDSALPGLLVRIPAILAFLELRNQVAQWEGEGGRLGGDEYEEST